MFTEYLDLHIPQKRKDLKLFLKKEELSFIFESSGSLTNNKEKFMKCKPQHHIQMQKCELN